ncbi:MAG: DUF4878 domain-containing protein [Bacillota bacterium]|nr:DUF4878 domain-containing protein [Bacillota bacterium]
MKKKLLPVLCLLIACLLVFTGCTQSGPGAAAKGFVDGMFNGDIDTAFNYVEPSAAALLKPMFEAVGSETYIQGLMPAAGAEMPTNISTRVVSEEITGDTATVTLEITATVSGVPQSRNIPMSCKKVDGKWYVDLMSLGQ